VTTPEKLAAWEIFALGCAGGFVSYLVILALPEFRKMAKTGTFKMTWPRGIGFAGILLVLVFLGGAAAWYFADDTASTKDAVAYGLGAEGLLAGLARELGA
jgi:hypothetical protein